MNKDNNKAPQTLFMTLEWWGSIKYKTMQNP